MIATRSTIARLTALPIAPDELSIVLECRRHAFKERNGALGREIPIRASDSFDFRERLIDAFNCSSRSAPPKRVPSKSRFELPGVMLLRCAGHWCQWVSIIRAARRSRLGSHPTHTLVRQHA